MSETNVHGIDAANMERRTFLKGSMTAAALLGAAGMFGCAPNAGKQEEAKTADVRRGSDGRVRVLVATPR